MFNVWSPTNVYCLVISFFITLVESCVCVCESVAMSEALPGVEQQHVA